jgi:SAM-dependent methyltransferase
MSSPSRQAEARPAEAFQAPQPPIYVDARDEFAGRFLTGAGLEIGPLHLPLRMQPHAKASYVDRMRSDDLRREYPELADWNLTEVDIVDDGERLLTIAEESQDFIVANHFLEHCENPIRTIQTHLGKLKPGGILFYAVPDKRYTFDFRRPPTPLEHMVTDFEEGPERSRGQHYDEWTRLVLSDEELGEPSERSAQQRIEAKARELEAAKYSIHMHVWTQAEFLRLILDCRVRFDEGFDIEAAAKQGIEFMVVLRKRGAHPPVSPVPAPRPIQDPRQPASDRNRLRGRVKRALLAARRELRKTKTRP